MGTSFSSERLSRSYSPRFEDRTDRSSFRSNARQQPETDHGTETKGAGTSSQSSSRQEGSGDHDKASSPGMGEPDSFASLASFRQPMSLSSQTRTRGNQVYKQAVEARNTLQLETAFKIYRRAAKEAGDAGSNAKDTTAANKNTLKALAVQLKWEIEDCPDGVELHAAFLEKITIAGEAFSSAANASGRASVSSTWSANLLELYTDHLRRLVDVSAIGDASSSSNVGSSSRHALGYRTDDKDYIQTYVARSKALAKILSLRNCPFQIKERAHFMAAEVRLKASVVSLSHRDFQNAVSIISTSEPHVVALTELQSKMRATNPALALVRECSAEEISSQVFYQRCAAESSQRIFQALQQLDRCVGDGETYEMWSVLPAIDLFKEAHVLARDTSLEQEAQAAARLGKIFRTFPDVRDNTKATAYYNHAFSLLQSIGPQALINEEWARDVRMVREEIQRENSISKDAKKAPVLEKHKEMLQAIRGKLGVTDEAGVGLLFLYERYPPKNAKAPEDKIQKGDMKAAIKDVLLHYHPDRNGEAAHGFEHSVLCEEITKHVNLLYSRLFKNM